MSTVHILDDNRDMRTLLRAHVERLGFTVEEYANAQYLTRRMSRLLESDIVLLDIMLADSDGFEVLAQIRENHPNLPVIMITALDDNDTIVRCLRLGANDYIQKPINATRLEASLRAAQHTGHLTQRLAKAEAVVKRLPGVQPLSARSATMRKVLELVDRVKDSEATILLTGESGVGKEVLARALHFGSRRTDMPFVAINCAAIPATLLESELFGHEAGAFTGADQRRKGKFEAAGQGTIFLDEIGEMPLESQVRFLRVLQERKLTRLGGSEEIPVHARIVCATNRKLEELISAGRFREDLFYRINTFPIEIPALRRRREDIPALVETFLKRFREQEAKDIRGVEPDALEAMERYSWPGNVRQLENVIERAVLLCDSNEITIDTLPQDVQSMALPRSTDMGAEESDILPIRVDNTIDAESSDFASELADPSNRATAKIHGPIRPPGRMSTGKIEFSTPERIVPLSRIERSVIVAALRACGGDISEAARRLEVSRGWIYRRLRSFGIDPNMHRD